jgi:hypothetical protein
MAENGWTLDHSAFIIGCIAVCAESGFFVAALYHAEWNRASLAAVVLMLLVLSLASLYRKLADQKRP